MQNQQGSLAYGKLWQTPATYGKLRQTWAQYSKNEKGQIE